MRISRHNSGTAVKTSKGNEPAWVSGKPAWSGRSVAIQATKARDLAKVTKAA